MPSTSRSGVKNSIKSNMYEATLNSLWEKYDRHLTGQREALIGVVSSCPLESTAIDALQSSCSALGYGKAACTFIALEAKNEATSLAEKELLALIEGLDPLFLIITDENAVNCCSDSYHRPIPLDCRSRVLGREVRAFTSLEELLKDSSGKQKAWGLLKTLPKLES